MPPKKSMIQEIFSVSFFLSRASSASKSTIFTQYINMSQKDIQQPKSLASWQEAFFPCGCRKGHRIHREWWMRWTDWTTTDGWIYYCSPACCCVVCQHSLHKMSCCFLPASCLIAAWTPSPAPSFHLFLFLILFCKKNLSPPLPVIFLVTLCSSLFLLLPSLPPSRRASQFSFLSSLSHSKVAASLGLPSSVLQKHWPAFPVLRWMWWCWISAWTLTKIHNYLHDTLSGYSIVITVHWN